MDSYQDFSQFLFEKPVLKTESNTNEFCDIDNCQDIDFTYLFEDIPATYLETSSIALSYGDVSYENNLNSVQPTAVSNVGRMLSSSSTCFDSLLESKPKNQQIASKTTSPNCKEKKKTYECSVCNKIFSRNCNLIQHKRSHMKEKLPEYIRKKLLTCEVCSKVFSTKAILKRHKLLHKIDENRKHSCEFCDYAFTRKDLLNNHLRNYRNSTYVCTECNRKFCRRCDLKTHTCDQKTELKEIFSLNPYCEKVKDFKRKNELKEISTTTFDYIGNSPLDLKRFLKSLTTNVEYEIKYNLYEKKDLKCSFMLEAVVGRSGQDEENELSSLFLHSNTIIIFSESGIRKCIEQVFSEMIDHYLQLKDIWTLHKIIKLEILTVKFNSS